MRRILLAGAALAVISGCSTGTSVTTQTRKAVASYGVAVTEAEKVAVVYALKPQCDDVKNNGPDGIGCSNKATITVLKSAGQRAHDAYFAARAAEDAGGEPNITAIKTALAAFNAALPSPVTPVAIP